MKGKIIKVNVVEIDLDTGANVELDSHVCPLPASAERTAEIGAAVTAKLEKHAARAALPNA